MSRTMKIWTAAILLAGLGAAPSFAGETTPTTTSQQQASSVTASGPQDCSPDKAVSKASYDLWTGMERKGGPRSATMKVGPKWVGSPFVYPDQTSSVAGSTSHDCSADKASSKTSYELSTGMERKGGPRSATLKVGPKWVGSPFVYPEK